MKIQKACFSVVLALTLATAMVHGAEIFNFNNITNGDNEATIQFNGTASSFQFDPTSGFQWDITSESGESDGPDAVGLQGYFSGGPWIYGGITSISGIQYATVTTTSGMLTINDGAGYLATANVDWVQVLTTSGGAGYLNVSDTVNLSDLSYSGTNPDLESFFSAPAGILTLSFQFLPVKQLSDLTSGSGPYTTSFSGSLTPVPEPGTLAICGLGFALLLGRRIFKR